MGFKTSTRAAAVAAGLALALAACGGGGSLGDGGGDSGNDSLEDLLGELGIDTDELEGFDLDELEGLDLGELENLDADDLEGIGGLGALAEVFGALGLEELIEQGAGGDVDIELGEDGISIESEDGSFSIDEDGSFSVTDEDGDETTGNIDIDADGGEFSIEGEDGDIQFGSGSEIPDEWPDDIPQPDGVTVQSAATFSEGDETSIILTGTADDDPDEWTAAYGSQLEDAGFTQDSNFSSSGAVAASYTDESWNVDLTATAVGGSTAVSVSITPVT